MKRTEMITSTGRVLVSGVAGCTGSVRSDIAVDVPPAFFAVTCTRRRSPSSTITTSYVLLVAPKIAVQLVPSRSHRSHWYVNDVGLPLHVPLSVVSVWPTWALPVITGLAWRCGPDAPDDT